MQIDIVHLVLMATFLIVCTLSCLVFRDRPARHED